MKKAIIILPLLIMLSACAGSFESISPTFVWDAPPNVEDMKVKSSKYFEDILKDSESARYKYGTPFKGFTNAGLLFGGNINWTGWLYPVSVNAKNSYGGYTGYKMYYLKINNNRISGYFEKQHWDFGVNSNLAHVVY